MQHVLKAPNACFFRVLCPCLACSSSFLFIYYSHAFGRFTFVAIASCCGIVLYCCFLRRLLRFASSVGFFSFCAFYFILFQFFFCSIINAYMKCARLLSICAFTQNGMDLLRSFFFVSFCFVFVGCITTDTQSNPICILRFVYYRFSCINL